MTDYTLSQMREIENAYRTLPSWKFQPFSGIYNMEEKDLPNRDKSLTDCIGPDGEPQFDYLGRTVGLISHYHIKDVGEFRSGLMHMKEGRDVKFSFYPHSIVDDRCRLYVRLFMNCYGMGMKVEFSSLFRDDLKRKDEIDEIRSFLLRLGFKEDLRPCVAWDDEQRKAILESFENSFWEIINLNQTSRDCYDDARKAAYKRSTTDEEYKAADNAIRKRKSIAAWAFEQLSASDPMMKYFESYLCSRMFLFLTELNLPKIRKANVLPLLSSVVSSDATYLKMKEPIEKFASSYGIDPTVVNVHSFIYDVKNKIREWRGDGWF